MGSHRWSGLLRAGDLEPLRSDARTESVPAGARFTVGRPPGMRSQLPAAVAPEAGPIPHALSVSAAAATQRSARLLPPPDLGMRTCTG